MVELYFKKLRRRLTILPACIASLVVVLICAFSFQTVRSQYLSEKRAQFISGLTTVQNQWNTNSILDSRWLRETEASTQILLSLEENGSPLSFSLLDNHKVSLSENVKQHAQEAYGIYTHMPPISGFSNSNADFILDVDGNVYRCAVICFPSAGGWRTIIALQNTQPELHYLLRIMIVFIGITLIAITLMIFLCWFFIGKALKPALEIYSEQEEFIAAASHELRTPLTVIKTGLRAIRDDQNKVAHYTKLMESEADRMSILIEELLLLAGRKSSKWQLKKTRTEIDSLVLEIVEKMQLTTRDSNCRLVIKLPDEAPPVAEVDKHRIEQVVDIIINNACRFSPPGEEVTVTVKRQAKWIVISISDHGIGIPDEYKNRVFDAFFQMNNKKELDGSHYGLGLAVARELIHMHDGHIDVEDNPGGGATFRIKLPAG